MVSPFFRKGSDLAFERPGVARLLIDLPIGLGDRFRPHQPARIEIGEGRLALPLLDPLAHPCGVDAGVDDQVGDVDVLRGRARAPRSAPPRAGRIWRWQRRHSSQTLRNTRSVVSSSGKLTLAPMLKTQTSSGAAASASCRNVVIYSSLRASSER